MIAMAVLVVAALVRLVELARWNDVPAEFLAGWDAVLVAVLGLSLLGFVDDLLGDGGSRGFRGHLGALASGRITTGAMKLVGGGVVALLATAHTSSIAGPRWQFAVDVALVALAANLANLFDRAPGRVTKVAFLVTVGLVVAAPLAITESGAQVPPIAAVFVVGAALGLVVAEMREQMMLGDTGANAVGAALGIGAVMSLSGGSRIGIVVVLVVLNLASERISFSRVIAGTPGLRTLDQLGRLRE